MTQRSSYSLVSWPTMAFAYSSRENFWCISIWIWYMVTNPHYRCHEAMLWQLGSKLSVQKINSWHQDSMSTEAGRMSSSAWLLYRWNCLILKIIFKSPRFYRGDFMFLYRFVRCRRRSQILVHAITFEQLFQFLSFLAQLLALIYRLPDYILVDFLHDLDLEFSRSNMDVCYISAKNGPITRKQKANTSIEIKASNMTIGFDLDHDLDLEFSRSNMEFAISQPKMVRLPRNEKQTYGLISRPQMWPPGLTLAMTLTLKFQGQIWNFPYLGQKWSHCHKTKSKHIDWTPGLKCDHQMWPWPWPWPWIFKVKYGICYISTKSSPIATKRKANISIELQA